MNQVTIVVGKNRARFSSMNDALLSVRNRLYCRSFDSLVAEEVLRFLDLLFFPEKHL